jgi:hypothetical protein
VGRDGADDFGALAVAAEGGNEEALLAMLITGLSKTDIAEVWVKWVSRARAQDNDESNIWLALQSAGGTVLRQACR